MKIKAKTLTEEVKKCRARPIFLYRVVSRCSAGKRVASAVNSSKEPFLIVFTIDTLKARRPNIFVSSECECERVRTSSIRDSLLGSSLPSIKHNGKYSITCSWHTKATRASARAQRRRRWRWYPIELDEMASTHLPTVLFHSNRTRNTMYSRTN